MSGVNPQAQATSVAEICRAWLPGLIGVYLHGSAALGGMTTASDLDVLVIADRGGDLDGLGDALQTEAPRSPQPIELSVVDRMAAAKPAPPWPFLLHVNSEQSRAVRDGGAGDPDLIAHYAVTRSAGIAVTGPSPYDVIGPVDRTQLLAYFCDELEWGLANADQRYAVLNACRASRYAATGDLVSKVDGGRWWLETHGPTPVVEGALAAQFAGVDLGPTSTAARALVADVVASLNP